MPDDYVPKLHWMPLGSDAARCGRGPGGVKTTNVLEDVSCQQCINLANVGTWSPTRKRGERRRRYL